LTVLVLITLAFASQTGRSAKPPDAVYAPLKLYQGSWEITRKKNGAAAKSEHLVNDCALLGKYFACQQTVNGADVGLEIFIPAEKAGHYYTQTVMPEGRATGRGDLEISGDLWTYSRRWPQESGKIIYYRTTNVISGKDHIHFEQAESPDGRQWTIKDSGDEQRVKIKAKVSDEMKR
jgi:hypothetical protein